MEYIKTKVNESTVLNEGFIVKERDVALLESAAIINNEKGDNYSGEIYTSKCIDKNIDIADGDTISSEIFSYNGSRSCAVRLGTLELYHSLLSFLDIYVDNVKLVEDLDIQIYPENKFFILNKARCKSLRKKGTRANTTCERFLGWSVGNIPTSIVFCDRCKNLTTM